MVKNLNIERYCENMNIKMNEKINICGVFFNNLTLEEATNYTINKAQNGNKESTIDQNYKFLLVANQDIYNHLGKYKNLTYQNINNNFLTIPDGNSIIFASKFLKRKLKERVAGPDLMIKVLEESQNTNIKHFFFGSTNEVLEKLVSKIKNMFPDIKISGYYSPPFGDWDEEENKKIINIINDSKSDIIWVSLGCPKQEWWIVNNQDKIDTKVMAGVGAAFDFISENKKRAPVFIQKIKLEWLFRIVQEPKRLWKRYFFGGINFIKLLLKEKYKKNNINN